MKTWGLKEANDYVYAPVLGAASVPATGYEAKAIVAAARAVGANLGFGARLASTFSETVGPTGLALDRGLAGMDELLAAVTSWQGQLLGIRQEVADSNVKALQGLRAGGLPETTRWTRLAGALGYLGSLSDALTVADPEAAPYQKELSWANGLGTAAALAPKTWFGLGGGAAAETLGGLATEGGADWAALALAAIPGVGEVVAVGTGLVLGGDWLYHHWEPFRNVTKKAWNAVSSIGSRIKSVL